MKTSLNHYFTHFLRLVNLNTPQGRKRELEETIENLDVSYRLHALDDSNHHYSRALHEAQAKHLQRYGEYYYFGTYELRRRDKDGRRFPTRRIKA